MAIAFAIRLPKKNLAHSGQVGPIGRKGIDVPVRDPAAKMSVDVLDVLRFGGVDVAREVEVVFILCGGNFVHGNHACIAGNIGLFVKCIDNFVDVPLTKSVFVAVFNESFGSVNHKHAFAGGGVFFIQNHDAGRNARPIKQVGGQTDDALSITGLEKLFADHALGVAAK